MNKKWLISLVFLSFMPLIDLFHPGLFVAHDSLDHVARIANFYQSLSEGILIPRWAANLNWGYGHPILMFLYPLPSYTASVFRFFGFSFVDATKIVFGLGFLLSGLAMYRWIASVRDESAGFIAGLLYMFAPYRFVDLYVRGAIGENFFFIWPPLVCYLLFRFGKRSTIGTSIGIAFSMVAMILSHNALSIMFLPFIGCYLLLVGWMHAKHKLRAIILMILSLMEGFAISAFFWLPALLEGKYTLRDIVIVNEFKLHFETIQRLLYSPWNYGGTGIFSAQIGLVQWVMVLLAMGVGIYILVRRRKGMLRLPSQSLSLLILGLVFFVGSIFFMLPISIPVYEQITVLQKFQFPWRFLSLSVFSTAVLGGVIGSLILIKHRVKIAYILGISVILMNYQYWHAKGFIDKPDEYYSSIYHGTTDTGESAPIWSVRFMEHEPKVPVEVVEGIASVNQVRRNSIERQYVVDVTSETARILENTLYFPNWTVYVDGVKKDLADIWFQDPNYRGLINFFLIKGLHTVDVRFENTKIRTTAELLSVISLGILLIFSVYGKVIESKKFIVHQ